MPFAPVRWDHPAYRFMRGGDGDGVVCEQGCKLTVYSRRLPIMIQ